MRHADEPGRRYHVAMSRCVVGLLMLGSLAAGCDRAGANGGANRPLVVFAAASMGDVIREVADGFERAHGAGVEISAAARVRLDEAIRHLGPHHRRIVLSERINRPVSSLSPSG